MHFHFQVNDLPVSHQGKSLSKKNWRNSIWNHIEKWKVWPGNHLPEHGAINGPVAVRIKWYVNNVGAKSECTHKKYGDVDNIVKPILDALVSDGFGSSGNKLISDDSNVVDLHIQKVGMKNFSSEKNGNSMQQEIHRCIENGCDLLEITVTTVWYS
jgi:Holliday junction resolvase RusA-like endonuclease